MRNQPRVLMLVENNGYPRDFRVRREALALRDMGCQVRVICPREDRQAWRESIDGVEVMRFPAPRGGSGVLGYALEFGYATFAMLLLSIWAAIRHGVDVIHAANPPDTLFLIGAVLKPFGKRFVFDHHDLAPEIYLSRFASRRRNLIYWTLQLLERGSYALADVVIGTNESFRQRAISVGRKRPEQVFVVRNGPPLSYQPCEPPEGLTERARHLIGYVGTIGPQDGLDYWLRSIHHLVHQRQRRDFLAVIIGDGDAMPTLLRAVQALDIAPYVLFTGRLPEHDVRRYLSAVSLCVQPDPSNPLNDHSTMNKLMEYMALGKATVAFDLKETRASGGEAAVYVMDNDVRGFASEVDRLLGDAAERERMGRIGQARVREALAWEFSVPHLRRAYQDGLGLDSERWQEDAQATGQQTACD